MCPLNGKLRSTQDQMLIIVQGVCFVELRAMVLWGWILVAVCGQSQDLNAVSCPRDTVPPPPPPWVSPAGQVTGAPSVLLGAFCLWPPEMQKSSLRPLQWLLLLSWPLLVPRTDVTVSLSFHWHPMLSSPQRCKTVCFLWSPYCLRATWTSLMPLCKPHCFLQ